MSRLQQQPLSLDLKQASDEIFHHARNFELRGSYPLGRSLKLVLSDAEVERLAGLLHALPLLLCFNLELTDLLLDRLPVAL